MKCTALLAALVAVACNSKAAPSDAATDGSSTTTTTTADPSTTTTDPPPSTSPDPEPPTTSEITTTTTTTDESSSSSEATPADPAECEAALSERDCESITLRSTPERQSPSCQWLDIHTVETSRACTLTSSTPRCVLFFGNLLGCGGPGCAYPNDGELIVRDLGDTSEILIYPGDDVCGPRPAAPDGESQWETCAENDNSACGCICDQL